MQMKYGVSNLDVWYFMDESDSIKRDLLLFDKILFETGEISLIEKILGPLPYGKELLRYKLKEIDHLEKKGLIEYFDIKSINAPKEIFGDEEVKYNLNKRQDSYLKISGMQERNKDKNMLDVYTEFMELDRTGAQYGARYKSIIANKIDSKNEYIPIIKNLDNSNPEDWKVSKENVVHIVLKKIPVISKETSIDQVLEFKENSDIKTRYYELRDFITNISKSNLSLKEIEDKIEYLQDQYSQSLNFHKLKYDISVLEIFCVTAATVIENISTLKFSKAVKTIFELNKKEILLIEAEKQFKGREISYIYKLGEIK